MEYFKLIQLDREPFANSPDPAFFYASRRHKDCLQRLEIALRLRRGLNVVTGPVGTGKTTLCRRLLQALSGDGRISAGLILDPDAPGSTAFLDMIVRTVTGAAPGPDTSIQGMKEHLKQHLFQQGVAQERTVVLIIDEGQKMAPASLELLRELLNFETNTHKLLQIVIFAQDEFSDILGAAPNLSDRINLHYRLGPLSFKETRALVAYRLSMAGAPATGGKLLFSRRALWRIHRLSGGYPRKIIHLCHQSLLTMIIQDRATVGWKTVNACDRRTRPPARHRRTSAAWVSAAVLCFVLTAAALHDADLFPPEAMEKPVPAAGGRTPAPAGSADARKHTTPAPEAAPPTVPKLLGSVSVASGDTLSDLIRQVYGAYTFDRHQAVAAANPQMEDPHRLTAGDRLAFPALPEERTGGVDTTWWVLLDRADSLSGAMDKLRRMRRPDLPLRLLVYQAQAAPPCYGIVLPACFPRRSAAALAQRDLFQQTNLPAELLHLPPATTRIFGSVSVRAGKLKRRPDLQPLTAPPGATQEQTS